MARLSKERQNEIDTVIEQIQFDTGLSYPQDDLVDIAKALGIEAYAIPLPDWKGRKVKGFIDWIGEGIVDDDHDGIPKIYINKSLPPNVATFTFAHELGHFVLHKEERSATEQFRVDFFDYTQDTKESQEETEANYFAASFLVPKDKLKTILNLSNDINKIAAYFGVSRPVIENRIKWIQRN